MRYAIFFFSSRRRHTRSKRDWSSDVCSSDLFGLLNAIMLSLLMLDVRHTKRATGREHGVKKATPPEETWRKKPRISNARGRSRSEERRVGKEWQAGW